jgi:hypothetical protein
VDGPEAGTVAGSHVLVEGVDSRSTGHLTVLLVHVVSAGAGVVTDPDSEVLDLGGALLVDLSLTQISHQSAVLLRDCRIEGCTHLVERHDLTSRLLDLAELLQKVPETGLGNNGVVGEEAHPVELGGGLSLGRQLAADDLVLVEAT